MEQLMEVDVHSLSAASVVASALASPLPFSTSFCSTACFVSSTCTKQVFISLPLFVTLHFTPTLHDPSLFTLLYFTPTLHDPSLHSHSSWPFNSFPLFIWPFNSLPLFMTLHFTPTLHDPSQSLTPTLHTSPSLHLHSSHSFTPTIIGGSCHKYNFCRNKTFVVTNVCIILLQQTCLLQQIFVMTKVLSR